MMRYGSVCSGIEAASVAWEPLGWECAWVSEIDPFANAVLAHRYPGVPNLGDFTRIGRETDGAAVDLLVGGTPCQDYSVAGERAGMAGDDGRLALEYVALLGRLRPRWLVWENVPGVLSSGGGRDFGAFLGGLAQLGYGFAYRVLDAQYFGVPQRRRRVFVVGHLGDWRPPGAVLFERASLSGHPAPRRGAGADVAGSLGGGSGSRGWCSDVERMTFVPYGVRTNQTHANGPNVFRDGTGALQVGEAPPAVVFAFDHIQDPVSSPSVVPTLGGAGHSQSVAYTTKLHNTRSNQAGKFYEEYSPGLQTNSPAPALLTNTVRRLTPRECERLQGLPDDWTLVPWRGKPAPDGPRYKAIGNSMAVPVMRWIGERIALVEGER